MRRILAGVAIVLLAACQSSGESEPGVKQYRAWCRLESKPLGNWTTDRAAAQAAVDAHLKLYPHHGPWVKAWTGPLQTMEK